MVESGPHLAQCINTFLRSRARKIKFERVQGNTEGEPDLEMIIWGGEVFLSALAIPAVKHVVFSR